MKHMHMATILLLLALLAPSATVLGSPGEAETRAGAPAAGGLLFVENAGQWPEAARFQVWGGGGTVWLAEDAVWLTIVERSGDEVEGLQVGRLERLHPERANLQPSNLQPKAANVRLSFLGANPHPRLEPFGRLEAHVSYFLGNDPAGWRPDVPVWSGVRYRDLYPGVDLVMGAGLVPALDTPALGGGWPQAGRPQPRAETRGRWSPLQWRLEGADLAAVRLRVEGADTVTLDGDVLRLSTAAGEVVLPLLTLERANVERANVSRVNVSAFDVIAPFAPALANRQSKIYNLQSSDLLYGTFLGGSWIDSGLAIAVDAEGSAYVTGETLSVDFPAAPGAFDASYNGDYDAFVVKLDPAGTTLVYATFLGGGHEDWGQDIAVDAAGRAYVTGETSSSDFPTTPGAFDTSYNGGDLFPLDVFVVKLDPAGSTLVYATFLGGSSGDGGSAIAVDAAGSAYVTGETGSSNFPTTPGAFDTSYNGGWYDAFVVKLNPTGSALAYATFLGGSRDDFSAGIAVDAAGSAYVTGNTYSSDFPATPGAFDTSFNGDRDIYDRDAYVAKLNPAGSALAYATFLGGRRPDVGLAIAVDAAGSAYVTGWTDSSNFPVTPGVFDTRYNGGDDGFVVKLNPTGSALAYATFLGGSDADWANAIAVDGAGRACVTGVTYSGDFPTTPGAFDTSFNGSDDAFVVKLLTAYPPAILGTVWHDVDGDGTRDAGEPGIAGVQVCAEPLGHRPIRCATTGPDGSYTIDLDVPGTYLVAPSTAPQGMQLTTPGFRLPVIVGEGQQTWDIDFGYR